MHRIELSQSDKVVQAIFEAILSCKLNPGAKLSEIALQEEFGISRTNIREGFLKLVGSGVLTRKKNQGVRVAYPSAEQTTKIYQARKIIERGIIQLLVQKDSQKTLDTKEINKLIRDEKHLHHHRKTAELIKQSCDFHLSLARLCGNEFLIESLKPLISLSVLASSIYADQNSGFCSFDEHQRLLDTIKGKNQSIACAEIENHLDRCVMALDFSRKQQPKTILSHIFETTAYEK